MSPVALLIFLVLVQMTPATVILDRNIETEAKNLEMEKKLNKNQHLEPVKRVLKLNEEFIPTENRDHDNKIKWSLPNAYKNEWARDIENTSQIFNTATNVHDMSDVPFVGVVQIKNARNPNIWDTVGSCVLVTPNSVAISAVLQKMLDQFCNGEEDRVRVRFGASCIKTPGPNMQERNIAKDAGGICTIFVHPEWNKKDEYNYAFNVAMMMLSAPLDTIGNPYVQPAKACQTAFNPLLMTCAIYSWGQLKTGEEFEDCLTKRSVFTVPHPECWNMWNVEQNRGLSFIVPQDSICTSWGMGECKGYTGTPLGDPRICGTTLFCPDVHVSIRSAKVQRFLNDPENYKLENIVKSSENLTISH